MGIVRAGAVSATIGTSGVVFAATDSPALDKKGRVHTFCHAVPGRWHVMGVTQAAGGNEITLQYKDGTQKILVPPGTPIVTFTPGDRLALKPGETIFTTARMEADGKLSTQRIQVSKDGVRPAH